MTRSLLCLSAAFLSVCSCLSAQPVVNPSLSNQNETPVRTKHAMVVSIHHLATDAGVEILKDGGNAVDAAVVHPVAGNIGGGGFMLIHLNSADGGKSTFIDYREKAPLAATVNMYLDDK